MAAVGPARIEAAATAAGGAGSAVAASAGSPAARGNGILDLYRAAWAEAATAIARRRGALIVEVGLIALWFVLRTRYGVEARPYIAWTLLTCGVAVLSPTSGLVVLAATGPFYEPVTIGRDLGMRHILVAVLGLSVGARLVLGGWRRMPWSPPVVLAVAIGGLTLLGLANTFARFDQDFAFHAARTWLSSIGGAMIVLLVAVWVSRDGLRRPLAAALAAAVVAVGLSLVDHFAKGVVADGPLSWIGFWKDFNGRLGGAIPSPNGMASVTIIPAAVLIMWAFLDRGNQRLRLAALVLSAPLVLALYVTYSRAALLALFVVIVVLGWRIRRALGVGILVAGVVATAILLPSYLQLRSESALEGGVRPGSILVASDVVRFQAWGAASRMWQDEPLVGQGFLAYRDLGPDFGDPVLGSPHNEWLRLFAEEGTVGGLVGLAFVATTLGFLARRRDPIATGIATGAAGYVVMASFNNPLLFIQISSVVFTAIGYGLARSIRPSDPAAAPAIDPAAPAIDPAAPAIDPAAPAIDPAVDAPIDAGAAPSG